MSVLSGFPCLLGLPCLAGLAGLLEPPDSHSHPLDGPDVDLRLWIEEGQVSAHVVLNLAFVDEFIDLAREDEMLLRSPEYALAEELVIEFLDETLEVHVDGFKIQSAPTDFEVADPDYALLAHFPRFGTRAMQKLRTSLQFPLESPPTEVSFTWTAYARDPILSEGQQRVPMDIVAHVSAGGVRSRVTLKDLAPEFSWRGNAAFSDSHFQPVPGLPTSEPSRVPLLSGGLFFLSVVLLLRGRSHRIPMERRKAWLMKGGLPMTCLLGGGLLWSVRTPLPLSNHGRGLPTEEQALAIFAPLHTNIYRAFDFTNQSDIYDSLARSVHGELLAELYDQIHEGLIMQEEGAAVSEVQDVRLGEVTIDSITPDDTGSPSFRLSSQWQVDGAVFHSDHSHWRTNEYRARFQIAATAQGWRITDQEILAARRVDAGPIQPLDSVEQAPALQGEAF